MSNNDDGTYLQPMISNAPPRDDHHEHDEEYQYIRDPAINPADKPSPLTGAILQSSAQTSSANSESPYRGADPSTDQPEMEYDDCINTMDSEVSADERKYMDLDLSSRQPDSVYQEVNNPDNLKQPDMYHALDLKSRSTDSEYQALGPQNSEPTYDTEI